MLEYSLRAFDPKTHAWVIGPWEPAQGVLGILGFLRSTQESTNCAPNRLESVARPMRGCAVLTYKNGVRHELCFRKGQKEGHTMTSPEEQEPRAHNDDCTCDACQYYEYRCHYCNEWLSERDNPWTWRVYDGDIIAHDTCRHKAEISKVGEQADDLHDRPTRQHGRLIGALAGMALAVTCFLPGHVSAHEDTTQGFLTPPANCTLYLAFEDHSSLAYCETDGFIAFDPDGPVTGWHLSHSVYRTQR